MAAATGSLIMAGTSLAGGIAGAGATRAQGEYQRQQAYANAAAAEDQAVDAVRRGEKDAQGIRKQTRNLIGDQRVAAAAAGLDVNYGGVAEVQSEAMAMGEQDAATTRVNALKEAWGFKSQAASYRGQGDMAQMAAKNQARNTILTGGLSALSHTAEGYSKSLAAKRQRELDEQAKAKGGK